MPRNDLSKLSMKMKKKMCFIRYHSRTHLLLIVFFLVCGLSGSSLIGWIRAAVLLRLGFLSIFLPSARPIWNAMYDSKLGKFSFQAIHCAWDTSDAGILIFIFIIRFLRLLGWTVEERKIRPTKIRLNLILTNLDYGQKATDFWNAKHWI